ncbi:MAG: O-methyltransferase [Gemmatimonadales bacterium]
MSRSGGDPAEVWSAVDRYIEDKMVRADPALDAALAASVDAGLPAIAVSPVQGKLLHIVARAMRATAILEIGTLGGYSAIWLARALLPGGRLITIERDPRHARIARANVERAGVDELVELRTGDALDVLPQLAAERAGPFDLTFIDADKPRITEYFDWALQLSRVGSLIVVDNVIRNGAVVDPASTDPDVQGVRRFNDRLAREPRVAATAIQTVGVKGYDGFAAALVLA